MKKVMFISDIHGSTTSLDQALKAYALEKPDKLVILGDILYHGPRNPLPEGYDPKAVIRQLNPIRKAIIAVRGNCDAEVDQMVLDFNIQSAESRLWLDGIGFFMTHGHLYNNQPPHDIMGENIFIQGHTHVPMIQKTSQGIFHVNPGSITLPKEGHPKTYAIYESKKITVKTLEGDCYIEALIE
jgi:putative phosphoesterase